MHCMRALVVCEPPEARGGLPIEEVAVPDDDVWTASPGPSSAPPPRPVTRGTAIGLVAVLALAAVALAYAIGLAAAAIDMGRDHDDAVKDVAGVFIRPVVIAAAVIAGVVAAGALAAAAWLSLRVRRSAWSWALAAWLLPLAAAGVNLLRLA